MSRKKKKATAAPVALNDKSYLSHGRARSLPIYKCVINEGWEEEGIADIFVLRKHVNGHVTVGVYLVDTFCAGVKDTFYLFNIPEERFEIINAAAPVPREECSYKLAHNIIYGAVAYAQEYGIEPHPDFSLTQRILEEDTEDVELLEMEFGLNGKPTLLLNPAGDPRADYYLRQLEKYAGPGNYDVVDARLLDILEDDLDDDFYAFPDEWNELDWEEFIDETEPDELKKFMEVAAYMHEKIVAAPTQAVKMLTAEKEYTGFTITYDALPNSYSDEELSEAAVIIQDIKASGRAETAVLETKERLQKNIARWPENPIFRNYLALVYKELEDNENAQETMQQLHEQFPDYLFGKIMYAEMLLDQGKAEQVPDIFKGQYNLKSVFPERDTFHISELVAFNTIMADYFYRTGDLYMANLYLNMLDELEIPESMVLNVRLFLEVNTAITQEMMPVLQAARQSKEKKQELIAQLVN